MTKNEINKLANDLIKEHYLLGWRFSFHNKKNSLGTCKYSTREILLSNVFIQYLNDYGIKMTLLHEIAHALTKGHNHDRTWARKCISIGGDGIRCATSDYYINGNNGAVNCKAEHAKYTFECPVCGNKAYFNRMPKLARSCGKHNTIGYNPDYKLVLVK